MVEFCEKVQQLGIKYKLTSAAKADSGFPSFLDELLTDYINKYNPRGIPQDKSFSITKSKHVKKKKGFIQTIKDCCKWWKSNFNVCLKFI